MKKPIILYHRDLDGFTAAFCFYLVLGDKADYKSVQYGEPPPDVSDRFVAIVDFSYPREVIEKMHSDTGGHLLVLDHHESAEEQLKGLPYCVFNKNKSGALLAFEHVVQDLRSKAETKKGDITHQMIFRLEKLARHVDDRDRWVFKMKDTRKLIARLRMLPMDFVFWKSSILKSGEWDKLVYEGGVICDYQDQLIDNQVRWCRTGSIDEHPCRVVNSPILTSDIGVKLAEGETIGVIWFQKQDGGFVYSLRSTEDGPDVGAIAKNWGGGGHKHAAGFSVNLHPEEVIGFDNAAAK